jgi:hypothetical protein
MKHWLEGRDLPIAVSSLMRPTTPLERAAWSNGISSLRNRIAGLHRALAGKTAG